MTSGISQKLRYTMPKEGRYEFRLGVTSGNGNASTPKDTDPADLTVVLDTTPPAIKRFEAKVDMARDVVAFTLDVSDANRDNTKPEVIEYLAPDGKWQVVNVQGVEWSIPEHAPAEVNFRLTATDLAGNEAARVVEKVSLDTTIPEGKLTKVRSVEPIKPDEKKLNNPPPPKVDQKK